MPEYLNELRAFTVVARAGSFTRAAESLGVSASALSHSMRKLEAQLNMRLLNRTTRSVSTTEAGEQLLHRLAPLFARIADEVDALAQFRDSLSGTLRINGTAHVFMFKIWQKLVDFLNTYPDVKLELACDLNFVDIVAGRFDAGIRLGESVEKDMVAVRIAGNVQMGLAASAQYVRRHGAPQSIEELEQHRCIGLKMPRSEKLMDWEFRCPDSQKIITFSPRHSQLTVNDISLYTQAALSHLGIIWNTRETLAAAVEKGELVEILSHYAIDYDDYYYLYYPRSRHHLPLFKALVAHLKC